MCLDLSAAFKTVKSDNRLVENMLCSTNTHFWFQKVSIIAKAQITH